MNTVTEDTHTPIDAEEQARADLYGLLSRLLAAPADSELLQGIAAIPLSEGASAQPGENAFVHAWSALVHSAATAQAGAIADEYHDLFVGSGRAEVTLYTGAYTARSSVETQLVALREYLAAQGLQRQTGVHEPEDHLAILFEIMRYLIAEARHGVEQQKTFFNRFLGPGGLLLCDAITAHPRAQFYRLVANLTKSFLSVEHDAFDM
jgi:TorA maturation chaperone TorD